MAYNPAPPNSTYIRPEWLIRQEQGQKCQPHSQTLGLIFLYNVISTSVSVLLASPAIFKQTKYVIDGGLFGFKSAWHWIRRKPPPHHDEHEEYNNQNINIIQLTLSVAGSVALSILSPIFIGLSIRKQDPSINLWIIISQWCLRPRSGFLYILFHGGLFIYSNISDDEQVPHGYYTTLLATLVSDAVVGAMGYPFLIDQIRSFQPGNAFLSLISYTKQNTHFDKMQSWFTFELVAVSFELLILVPFAGVWLFWVLKSVGQLSSVKLGVYDFGKLVIPAAIAVLLTYCASWMMWAMFFRAVPEEQYCLASSSVWISVIYCLLPVALGLWRSFCAIGLRSRTMQPRSAQGDLETLTVFDRRPEENNALKDSPRIQSLHEGPGQSRGASAHSRPTPENQSEWQSFVWLGSVVR